ncbi:hypothetical protein TALC_01368 [Thermoplasmatales archaeon BRNA1]|nr:hypothetical protein TALC_01368 [Thermoplasmatales archaeon BRNA1]
MRGALIRGKKYFASRSLTPETSLTSIKSSKTAFFSQVSMNGMVTVALSMIPLFMLLLSAQLFLVEQ